MINVILGRGFVVFPIAAATTPARTNKAPFLSSASAPTNQKGSQTATATIITPKTTPGARSETVLRLPPGLLMHQGPNSATHAAIYAIPAKTPAYIPKNLNIPSVSPECSTSPCSFTASR